MLFDKDHHNILLNDYVKKFGIQDLIFVEIKQSPENELNYWEMFFIKLLNPLCNGADKVYRKLYDDEDQKIFIDLSEKYKGKSITMDQILSCEDFKLISPKKIGMILKKNNIKNIRIGKNKKTYYRF
jgi:hypothetical protein